MGACFGLALFAAHVAAQSDPPSLYESQRVAAALQRHARTLEPQPEGKRIAFVIVEREEVFAPNELLVPIVLPKFASTWPNTFHWLTREDVVRRELLLGVGSAYEQPRIDESERNLRALGVFALVRIVAVRGDAPDEVGLLIYTRDLWSLRLETGFVGAGSTFRFTGQLSERNFLGRNKVLMLRTGIDPITASLGQVYSDPRIGGGDLSLMETFDAILNRESGELEGTRGTAEVDLPIRDLRQDWSWSASAAYADFIARGLRGSDIATYRPDPDKGLAPCLVPARECMRQVWDDTSYAFRVAASYQRGVRYRQTFTVSANASNRKVAANDETALRADQRADFARLMLPIARRQIYPGLGYGLWLPTYERYHDLGTFGQSETVRVGPELSASVGFPIKAFGSSTNSLKLSAAASYVLGDGDALGQLSLSSAARFEDGSVVDESLLAVLRGATPDCFLGRFVAYGSWFAQRRDTTRATVTLGGDNGLRGHDSGALWAISGDRLRANFEYRTLPVVIESVHVGLVAFYDVGSVYTELKHAPLGHAVGAGIRLLFPQLNRTPFAMDVGIPLEHKGFTVGVSYSTEQVVPLTAADDAAITAQSQ